MNTTPENESGEENQPRLDELLARLRKVNNIAGSEIEADIAAVIHEVRHERSDS